MVNASPGQIKAAAGSMSLVTLQTERLLLRPFEVSDGPAFHAYMSNPEVTRYTSFLPLSREQAQEIVDNIVQSRTQAPSGTLPHAFAITLRGGGQLIGNCRLGRDKDNPDQADVAYFFDRHYWGQDYATEAVRALIDYGFEKLALRRIVAHCVPENVASWRVMEKVGMQKEEPITLYAAQGNFHQGAFQDVTYLRYAVHHPARGERVQQAA
jgi:RimJ/RimL family protein N-acetyltransferase